MKKTRRFLLVSAASVLLGFGARAQTPARSVFVNNMTRAETGADAQEIKCAGTVTDAAGHPLAGATVEYWRYEGNQFSANPLALIRSITTEASGAFQFQVSQAAGVLLARKPGLAPAWKQLNQPYNSGRDIEETMVLTPPAALAGRVVDEADKPVTNAEVFVAMAISEFSPEEGTRSFNYFMGKPARDCFAARTDAAGHFRIGNFPTNATAAMSVQAPGKALRQSPQDNTLSFDSLPWRAGQEDIKLVAEPAGSIEGKIIVEGSNEPPPLARLTLQPDGPGFFGFGEREPAQSGPDGAFHFADVAAGSYRVHAVFGTNAPPDWVAEAVPVSIESGQPTRGVQVTAARGGLLEVAVSGQNDHKPLADVMVYAFRESSRSAASSDSNGLALLRLPPGDYQVMASRQSGSGSQSQTPASVEAGKTNRVEIELAAPRKITGIVRQPDGQPAAGLPVRLVGGFGPGAAEVKTDADGRFDLGWNPRQNDQYATACVLVRDPEHNLAVAQDIDEDTGPLDLKLAPGLTLVGRAESGGKLVTNATATLIFWAGRSGMHLTGLNRATNTPGRFEIPAIPPGRKYGLMVSARGYGQKSLFDVAASAEAGRLELDPFELKLANLTLAGQVLDADDKPVAGAHVSLNGDDQPNGNMTTDSKGRFHFQVCEGQVRLFANPPQGGGFAQATAEAGDTNVVLQLGQAVNNNPGATTHKLKGTVTDAEGKPAGGAQLAVFPSFNGSQWTKTASNGAFNLTWSLQPWQLQNSGGALLVVRDTARNLAATEELPEETTNLDVKLKPALTVAGLVKNADESPLAGAEVGVWLKAGNMYDQFNERMTASDAQGAYEIKCLPPDAQYIVFASARGHGRSQQQVAGDQDTNRLELPPFVLKLADRVLAGQVLNENDKPVSGANVSLNGEDQPNGNTTTDSKGRFHFKVCEGQVRLFANSQQNGFASAQATAEAGDTNVVMTLGAQQGMVRQAPARAPLKGSPLPDLATVNLAADAAPASQPVLLCLFDAGQRSSRHIVRQLDEQAPALRQQGVTVLGIQAIVTGGEIFNEWKSSSPVSYPLGRAAEKSEKTKWATSVPALPWLILTDAHHRVVAEGFALDELDAQLKNLPK